MANGQPLKPPPAFRDVPNPKPQPQRKTAGAPAFYQPQKKKRSCCCRCCCCLCCIIFLLIFLLAIAITVFLVYFQPKVPEFKFRQLEMDKFNITARGDGTATLDVKAIIRVEVKNPNSKLDIYYGETDVTVTLDEETKLESNLPEFKQPANNVTILKFTTGLGDEAVDSTTGSNLKMRMKNQDVEVNAEVKTKVGIGVGTFKLGMLPINVNCGGVTMKQLSDGNTSPKCSFNTLRWITIR